MNPAHDVNPSEALAARILKVNHAGQNGAVHIYAGPPQNRGQVCQSVKFELFCQRKVPD